MSRLRWLVPNKILYFMPAPNADMKTVAEDNRTLAEMIKPIRSPVYLIVDVTGVNLFPGNLQMLRKANEGLDRSNIAWIVGINANPLGKFIGNMLAQVYRKQVRYVDSLESALAYLKQIDPNIDISLPMSQSKKEIS